MLKKTITYKDYNGNEQTEDFYFNLTEAELAEMNMRSPGGYAAMIESLINAHEQDTIIDIVKKFILNSYGMKSADGRKFYKSAEISKELEASPAFSILFMELATNDVATAEFIKGIIPDNIREIVNKSAIESAEKNA